jgi:hypothetical protein
MLLFSFVPYPKTVHKVSIKHAIIKKNCFDITFDDMKEPFSPGAKKKNF